MEIDQVILDKHVPCTVRDGTTLYADIYRPNREGSFPILLTRLPYSKDDPFYSHRYLDTNRLVQHGYVVIIQDVRGRFESEGEFQPFKHEAHDGYDTVEWAATLPYSSGKVGMFGLSYYGFTQLLAAREQPPHLKAIFPAMTLNDLRSNMIYQDGALKIASIKTWTLESIVPDLLKRKYKNTTIYKEKFNQWVTEMNHIYKSFSQTPYQKWETLEKLAVADYFCKHLSLSPNDREWEQTSITKQYQNMNIPAYHLAGWYDNFLKSTIENFQMMSEKTNQTQKLMIGPWTHGDFGPIAGERHFGIHASEDFLDSKEDLTNLHIRWFDYWLKNKDTGVKQDAPVKIFVMGINEWRDEDEWPLARTNYVPFYFHSNGNANSRFGDGKLSTKVPIDEPVDTFIHDPNDPIPTQGGQTLYHGVHTSGPRDQRYVEERDDVLVYTSAPLTEPLEVTGPIKVKLWAKSDAKDTDFTAKLIDVHPNQTAYNLTDGVIRAKYRNGKETEKELNGDIICYEIDLWATSNVFLPGHAIRVEIASSNHPRFDVNPNTGTTLKNTIQTQTATQTIYHNKEFPSHIVLPIVS